MRASGAVKDAARAALWRVAPDYMERRTRRIAPKLIQRLETAPFIFVHIPKTGGISVNHALYGWGNIHYTWRQWMNAHPIRFRQYLKFSIVRDPVDRFLSAYDFLVGGGFNEGDVRFADAHVRAFADAEAFVSAFRDDPGFARVIGGWLHFRRQTEFVAFGRTLMVDRLIPYEEMALRVPEILGVAELPRLNVTRGLRTPRGKLSEGARAFLEWYYQEDFDLHRFARAHATASVFGQSF